MSKCTILLAAMAVVLLSGSARAELVSFSAETPATYTWTSSSAVILEGIPTLASPSVITMNAQANSSFTIHITALNQSGFTWTGYILTLDPLGYATFVAGTAGSTEFKTVDYPDPCTLKFWAPDEVLPNKSVTLQFDIEIPGGSPHTFKLTQQPIPEPATVALLGLGVVVLLTRRR